MHARRRAAPGGRRQIATSAAGSSSSSSSSSARSKGYPITPKAIQVDQETAIKGVELPDVANAPADFNKGDMSKTVLGVILGGGAGTRLYPLTKKRAKPAVPLGANYRLIDIPVSNCINSGINKIYCLTQFNSASLNRHMSQAYNSVVGMSGGLGSRSGFVEVLAACLDAHQPSHRVPTT